MPAPERERAATHALAVAAVFVGVPALTLALATAGFAAGTGLTPVHLPVAAAGVVLAVAAASPGSGISRRRGAAVASCALVVIPLAAAIAVRFFDLSFDGQWYHQPGAAAFAYGWNPLAGPSGTDAGAATYVEHYAHGPAIAAGALIRVFGRLEVGKAWNLVLAGAAFASVLALVLRETRLHAGIASAIAALAALNPVAVTQLLTFYVDGQVASLLTTTLAAGLLLGRGAGPLAGIVLCAAAVGLVNAKFTGAAYAAIAGACLVAVVVAAAGRRAAARVAVVGGLAVVVGIAAVGWSPYVTNWRSKGHPLWPLAGPGTVDVIAPQLPPGFERMTRVEKLGISLFAASSRPPRVQAKWPFQIVGGEPPAFAKPDVHIGGFGPWFGGALLLAAASAFTRRALRGAAAGAVALAAVALASALANPEAWWARYAPQVWIVPIALACAGLLAVPAGRDRLRRGMAAAALVALCANAALVLVNATGRRLREQAQVRAQLAELAGASEPIPVRFNDFGGSRYRLREAGVRFREVEALPCPEPTKLVESRAELCLPMTAAPAVAPAR
jgi:hypothetical protein